MNPRAILPTMLTLTILATISGCGGGGPAADQPELAPVTGVVTMDGAPLPKAAISFQPTSGRASSATTDAEGRYELVYLRGELGAIKGNHVIRISTADEENDPMGDQGTETVPVKYNKKSKLEAIVEDGPNTIDFELTSK